MTNTTRVRNGQKNQTDTSPERMRERQRAHEAMLSVTNPRGHANRNHKNEMAPRSVTVGTSRRREVGGGKGTSTLLLETQVSPTSGKQYGSSSETEICHRIRHSAPGSAPKGTGNRGWPPCGPQRCHDSQIRKQPACPSASGPNTWSVHRKALISQEKGRHPSSCNSMMAFSPGCTREATGSRCCEVRVTGVGG